MKSRFSCLMLALCWLQGVQALEAREELALCRFKGEVSVSGPYIHLADLAELPPETAARSGQAPVWTAPPPGEVYTLTREFLSFRLGQLGLADLAKTADLPVAVKVQQNGVTVPLDTIVKTVRRHLESQGPWPAEELRIQVYPLEEPVVVPDSQVNLEVLPARQARRLGEVNVEIAAMKEGRLLKRFKVQARVALERQVVCASRPLNPQDSLNPGDVRLVRREVTHLQAHEYFTSPEQVVNRVLARPVGPEEILTRQHVSKKPVIKRGDEVTVILEQDGLSLTAKGVAGEEGYPGASIRVKNPRSQKEFQARVVDAKTVKVAL